jgi:hypothetical protein
MSTTRLKIDIGQGTVEVEGDDAFVRAVYADFKDRLLAAVPSAPATKPHDQGTKPKSPEAPVRSSKDKPGGAKKKKTSGGSATGSFVRDLDLSGGGKTKRLKDFYAGYAVTSNFERNLIFVYYLQHKLERPNITIDHVFTCYREVGVKVPKALQQSLWDTTNRRGWLDTSDANDLKVTVPGMNYIEHDMQKASSEE